MDKIDFSLLRKGGTINSTGASSSIANYGALNVTGGSLTFTSESAGMSFSSGTFTVSGGSIIVPEFTLSTDAVITGGSIKVDGNAFFGSGNPTNGDREVVCVVLDTLRMKKRLQSQCLTAQLMFIILRGTTRQMTNIITSGYRPTVLCKMFPE